MSIATRLRTALEQRKKGVRAFQRDMESLGIEGSSYPAINRALQGQVIPSVPFLEAAADLLEVRRAWLITGDGPMTSEQRPNGDEVRTQDFHAGSFPWHEKEAWALLVASLELPSALHEQVYDLAFTMPNMVADLDIGNVLTLAGSRVYRPAPEYREAMRQQLVSWHNFFTQWIEEEGADRVRVVLAENADRVAHRFVRSAAAVPANEPAIQRRRVPGPSSARR